MGFRKRLYSIIEVADEDNFLSKLYDWFMMFVIVVSIIPLAFKGSNEILSLIDKVTVFIFIIDNVCSKHIGIDTALPITIKLG